MNCSEAKTLFSPYLDGVLTGTQMQGLGRHLEGCGRCTQNYVSLRRTQQLLGNIGRRKAPPDLALKLRVAISGEVARNKRPFWAVPGSELKMPLMLLWFRQPPDWSRR